MSAAWLLLRLQGGCACKGAGLAYGLHPQRWQAAAALVDRAGRRAATEPTTSAPCTPRAILRCSDQPSPLAPPLSLHRFANNDQLKAFQQCQSKQSLYVNQVVNKGYKQVGVWVCGQCRGMQGLCQPVRTDRARPCVCP